MATRASLTNGELRADKFAATTLTWTLDVAQVLNGSVNSPPFTVDGVSLRFSIHNAYDVDDRLEVEAADHCGSFLIRGSLETTAGDKLKLMEFQTTVDFSERLSSVLAVVGWHCDQLRRSIGESRVVKLVATFFPEHPFFPVSERPNIYGCQICEREVHPSEDEDSRGELHQMTQPGISVVWTITIFAWHSWCDVQRSAVFDLGGHSFRLQVHLHDTAPSICVWLERVGGGKKEYFASFRSMCSKDVEKLDIGPRFQFRAGECHTIEWESLLELFSSDDDSVQLKIECSLIQENDRMKSVSQNVLGREIQPLLRDFKELLLTGQDSDVIVEVEGERFRVHQAILGIRCPFFTNMLKHDMVEMNTGVVKIPDYTADEFKDFLLYLYTGRVESTFEKALSLYRAADQYDVPDLKTDCFEFIERDLSVDNLCDALAFSLKYNKKELFNLAKQFFTKNMVTVIKSESWKQFWEEYFDEAHEMYIAAFKHTAPNSKRRKL